MLFPHFLIQLHTRLRLRQVSLMDGYSKVALTGDVGIAIMLQLRDKLLCGKLVCRVCQSKIAIIQYQFSCARSSDPSFS